MSAPVPLHADRGDGRTYTAADRCRSGKTSTHGGLTDGHLKLHPDLHHLDGRDHPNRIIGTSGLRKTAHSLILRGKFASPGVSSVADEARRLLKDGVLSSISLGFAVKESERLGKSPRDGIRATKFEALECSLVAVGLD